MNLMTIWTANIISKINLINKNLTLVQQEFFLFNFFRKKFNEIQVDLIIEMTWEDRTPFEAITF